MGTFKFFVGVMVIGAVVLFGIFVIPPYFANYQFEDDVKTEALTLTYTNKSEEDIRQIVLKKATEEGIDLAPQQIKVQRNGGNGSGSLLIEADYTVHVNFPGYPFDLPLHVGTKNKGVF